MRFGRLHGTRKFILLVNVALEVVTFTGPVVAAGGNSGRDVGPRDDIECGRNAVEGDAGGPNQIITQDGHRRSDRTGVGQCLHERAKAH